MFALSAIAAASKRYARKLASAAGYTYIDPANPTFETTWGTGNDPTTFRTLIAPQAKRIIIDGTTSINGNYHHVVDIAAAKVKTTSANDWWLLPQGGTTTLSSGFGEFIAAGNVPMIGTSRQNMACLGTYDPADKENDTKYNRGARHKLIFSGASGGVQPFYAFRAGSNRFLTFQGIEFVATDANAGSLAQIGGQDNCQDVLFEDCVFDHTALSVTGRTSASLTITSITCTGTTATVTTSAAHGYSTGFGVFHQGATVAAFNIRAFITVTSSTTYTYQFAGNGTTAAVYNAGSGYPSLVGIHEGPVAGFADARMFMRLTAKLCIFKYANDLQSGNTGNWYAQYTRGMRAERCMFLHNGWGDTMTRATPAYGDSGASGTAGCGPNVYKHNYYWDDGCDGIKMLDCVTAYDSSAGKLGGGNQYVQNLVSIADPIPFIASAIGNSSVTWASGSLMGFRNILQVGTSDVNSGTVPVTMGSAPWILQATVGSYYDDGLHINIAGGNQRGLRVLANGFPITTNVVVNRLRTANWVAQDLVAEDIYTTKTYNNAIWDEAGFGTNQQWSTLTAPEQAMRTLLLSRNVHSTFATAYGISVSQTGTSDDIRLRVMDYISNNWTARDWNYAFHEHFRSAYSI